VVSYLSTTNQPLAATRRPLPVPSHLPHDTTFDVPDDEPAAPKKCKADTAAATSNPPMARHNTSTTGSSPNKGKTQTKDRAPPS
jgi:hypothetical protein